MLNKSLLISKLEQARRDVTDAEGDLRRLIREMLAAPRAEKTTLPAVIDDAFAKLRSARTDLGEIEGLIAAEPD